MDDTEVKMTDAELKARYSETHNRCALCGIPESKTPYHRWPPGLQLAHIFGGHSRRNEEWDVLLLCETCHRAHHNSSVKTSDGQPWHNVTTNTLLAVKKELGELDVPRLAELWAVTEGYIEERATAEKIPLFFQRQRDKWSGPCLS